MIAGQVHDKAKNIFKVAHLVLPIGPFKCRLEELGIDAREKENKRFMGKAGKAGDGGEGWQQVKQECFVRVQGGGVSHKKNIGLGK